MKSDDLYIGLMSGTSLDAIDAVLINFSQNIRIIDTLNLDLPITLQQEIKDLNSKQDNELERSLLLSKKLAYLFSDAVIALLKKNNIKANQIIAIGSHGQTLRHSPNGKLGYSLQVGDPSTIAELTDITVVADFRNRDIAAGGQGAPLVPAFHQAAFGANNENRALINIGGMANISLLYKDGTVKGFDTGPGNVLMNHWAQQHLNIHFDNGGEWAKGGVVDDALLTAMMDEPYFQLPPPKSTGREIFDSHWLEQFELNNRNAQSIQATLLELTACTIINAIPKDIDKLYVCGGGAHNTYLMQRLSELSNKRCVSSSSEIGIDPDWVEATAFAWLAKQTINHASGNLPSVTGAQGLRILGGIYPKTLEG
jgi:anhydro-N-acetylmuramic acid kinase